MLTKSKCYYKAVIISFSGFSPTISAAGDSLEILKRILEDVCIMMQIIVSNYKNYTGKLEYAELYLLSLSL